MSQRLAMNTGLVMANTIMSDGQDNLFGKDFVKRDDLLAKIIFKIDGIQAGADKISGI